ncbi:MAG: phosphodiester glycosidase family protein [Brevibacterium sp.]|nr:phosphodiester glycosidase family protein [Brevibacterium sp.]MDN6188167.1 phosphodiester glycosidase family protein [Brevibacterium sp.]MDN6190282.1 phosphodiester glycosidase family protein [Brevibacterium sp.]MDN6666679.1 phosphodiester glycosidase family protein [Brevibacterium sp.]
MSSRILPSSSNAAFTRSFVLVLAVIAALLAPGAIGPGGLLATSVPASAAPPSDENLGKDGSVLRSSETKRVAPGLEVTDFSRLEDGGWNNGNVLTADLTTDSLSLDVRDTGTVASHDTTSEIMKGGKNGAKAVAAVNGTFFDINHSYAPIYTSVSRNGMRIGSQTPKPAFTLADKKAAVTMLSAAGTLTADGEETDLGGLNNPNLSSDAIGVYNEAWGDYSLNRPVGGPDAMAEEVARVTVVDGAVTKSSGMIDEAGDPDVPENGQVLLGRDSGAKTLSELEVGDEVEIEIGPSEDVDLGIGGSHQVLKDGEVPDMGKDSLVTTAHPRTAVGISKDGSELFVTTIDGRSESSGGMSLDDMGEFFSDIGAHNAINLDGGGSTTMLAREAGADAPALQNDPSDGEERSVGNALVFYSDAPAQTIDDAQIEPVIEDEDSVFKGLHRSLTGTALGANLEPIAASGSFSAEGGVSLADADEDTARVAGDATGTGRVSYQIGGHTARQELRVLGEAIGLQPSTRAINLEKTGASEKVRVQGFDSEGRRALIEPRDIDIESSEGLSTEDDGTGGLVVTAEGDSPTGSIGLTVGEATTTIPVTVGTESTEVLDFSDLSGFTDASDRATGSFTAGEPTDDGKPSIDLSYDFTTSSATRGYYLVPKEPVPVEGNTLAFEMMLRGDGSGAWPRLQVKTADGTTTNIDGDHLTFDGWQKVRFTVPAGLSQPLTLERIRFMETRSAEKYMGEISIADLRAVSTPQTDDPKTQAIHDPALLSTGSVAGRPQQVAVMSDAQFVATDPNSESVEGARRTLREIRKADPDLLVINGDFVDEASPADFKLAESIIADEWTEDIPYVYVPGNHEIMGGEIENFESAFGSPTTARTVGRTKVLTLNSSAGSLHGSDSEQLRALEDALAEVDESDHLTGITVFFHHPPQDPLPSKTSQLGDRREAAELEKKLGEFRESSGKSAAVINGHVGVFHGAAVEGVSYLINGNSGKNPAGTPATGGFTGWTMLGIDPGVGEVGKNPGTADRVGWMAAETKPHVDSISVDAPSSMAPGQSADLAAEFTQGERTVPVGWPATAQWGGDGVVVDAGAEVDMQKAAGVKVHAQTEGTSAPEAASDVVRINPATGEITAENPGTAVVEVTVNGQTAKATVEVAGDEPPPTPGDDEGDEDAGADEDGTNASSDGSNDDGASAGSDDGTSAASDDGDDDANGSDGADGTDGSDGSDSAESGASVSGSDDSNSSDDSSNESGNRDGSTNDGSATSGGASAGSDSDGSSDGGGDLPRTGGPVLLTAGLGALLVIGGLIVARFARARIAGRLGNQQ